MEQRKKIKFSHIYEKLRQQTWHTLRPWTSNKESYYQRSVGSVFDVVYTKYGEETVGTAILVSMNKIRLEDLPEEFLDWDTEYYDGGVVRRYSLPQKGDYLLLLFVWDEFWGFR
jgi:hypothetical protein